MNTKKAIASHLSHMRNGFQEVEQLDEAVVADAALLPKVVMICRNKLSEWHAALGVVFEQVDHLVTQLRQLLTNQGAAAELTHNF